MAAKNIPMNLDLSEAVSRLRELDFRNPAALPVIPRYGLLLLVAAAIFVFLWFVWLNSLNDDLGSARDQETKLRQDYTAKLQKAVALNDLKEQKKEITQYVDSLEKQLPGKSEMDALLSDINQAGLERNLQFELFRPGNVVLKEYYAELPIALKITGSYHDIGAFAADVAGFSRIVTLNDLNLSVADKKTHTNQLTLNATARTFRYLDSDEVKAQAKIKAKDHKNDTANS
jgi:type IV pilus assembly protein PilO